jgi:hypothetical protein
MKKVVITSLLIVASTVMLMAQQSHLNKKEKKEGWIFLFDGKTTAGWKCFNGSPFPESSWKIENGILTVVPTDKKWDIVTEEEFSDFELSVDFRISKGANSGIKYFVLPNTNLGCEFQILDDAEHPDAKLGKDGNRLQGGLYDLIAPTSNKKDKRIGKWNKARIISTGQHVEHWLNGKKVVSYERGSDDFNALIAESKYKNNKNFASPQKSPILLQDHSDVVSFRNIKIRKIQK